MAVGLHSREQPDCDEIKRSRPMHRPNHPKQNRTFHQTTTAIDDD
jgi:hypothetical protein